MTPRPICRASSNGWSAARRSSSIGPARLWQRWCPWSGGPTAPPSVPSPANWTSPATGTHQKPTPRSPPTSASAHDPAAGHSRRAPAITGDATVGVEFLDRLRHEPDIFLSPVTL
ncbi:Toxin antitoxin genome stability system, pilT family protein [Micromonospora lupini str. Lupac 08]|uniref:Toxin antitoxin genome stability system, pilT family protein n=1 Tax=Micromonospora lupini str. Lupac 08 TaxID=1150864 RepID=I0KWG0_9ACTN|nr:Toxin antitoxin genome stability system, pilT family protein [Micromonospora lupini str. Lupac 08]